MVRWMLGFPVAAGIPWSNNPVEAGGSVVSSLVGARDPMSCYSVGVRCSLSHCPDGRSWIFTY
jgi:hypothetical protein